LPASNATRPCLAQAAAVDARAPRTSAPAGTCAVMSVVGCCAARAAVVTSLVFLYFLLLQLWHATGMRRLFTRQDHRHLGDLRLALGLANTSSTPARAASLPSAQQGRLALLFMLRSRLEHLEAWKAWLAPELGRAEPRVTLYFHLADGVSGGEAGDVAALHTLPGARPLVPTVATGWCELMAAEVALLRAALVDDPSAQLLVLLPHDAVPLAPLDVVLSRLLTPGPSPGAEPRTRICPAGVRGMDVPAACAHAIEPHWTRGLLLKHHQWLALSRTHAERMVDGRVLRAAARLFQGWFLGEPTCSDEVLPLLALALPQGLLARPSFSLPQLPLFQDAARGLAAFDAGLRSLGIVAECITYAPWPGCRKHPAPVDKRAKSPLVGGGLAPEERDGLMRELAERGVLFARKLGLGGGGVASHLALISRAALPQAGPMAPAGPLRRAPPRLLPEPDEGHTAYLLGIWLRWGVASFDALVPLPLQIPFIALVSLFTGCSAVAAGGIAPSTLRKLAALETAGLAVVFFVSVAAFSEYSLLEPLRGGLQLEGEL